MPFLDRYDNLPTDTDKYRLLFRELQTNRQDLYRELRQDRPVFGFNNRDGETIYLLTKQKHIRYALTNFSSKPYQRYGSGRFVLGLDEGGHQKSRHDFLYNAIGPLEPDAIEALQASIGEIGDKYFAIPRHQGELKVPYDYARTVVLVFVCRYFGIPERLYPYLRLYTQTGFEGFIASIFARHFVPTDPVERAGERALGKLGRLLGGLLAPGKAEQSSVIGRMAEQRPDGVDGEELGILLVGAINGTIDNAVAGVCNALDQLLARPDELIQAIELAHSNQDDEKPNFRDYVQEALRLDPPAPFLPRFNETEVERFSDYNIELNSDVILCMGSAMMDDVENAETFNVERTDDPNLRFGDGLHKCVAETLGRELITETVRNILKLPGIHRAQGDKGKLKKKWGAITENFDLAFDRRLAHGPLNVVMKVRQPVEEHALKLKGLIQFAAPEIVDALDTVGTVHFARFLFLDNDSKLALLTTYDGDFNVYLNDFIDVVGDLFDKLMEHLEDAPPRPVRQYRREFIDTIRKYDVSPAEGFFYSAYPDLSVQNVLQNNRESS